MIQVSKNNLNTFEKNIFERLLDLKKYSELNKKQVSAIIFSTGTNLIFSEGVNSYFPTVKNKKEFDLQGKTSPTIIHAEEYAITKFYQCVIANMFTGNVNINNTSMMISYSPCWNCCKMIISLGIKRILIHEINEYDFLGIGAETDYTPLQFLKESGVQVYHITD